MSLARAAQGMYRKVFEGLLGEQLCFDYVLVDEAGEVRGRARARHGHGQVHGLTWTPSMHACQHARATAVGPV